MGQPTDPAIRAVTHYGQGEAERVASLLPIPTGTDGKDGGSGRLQQELDRRWGVTKDYEDACGTEEGVPAGSLPAAQ
ncbi:hypothetical protein JG688_00004235, partial [Phytophthora aleatoria]